jgi:hypothetical protein
MSLLILFPAAQGSQPTTGTATFDQTAAWAATQTERIPATAAFGQSASWAATTSERLTSTASYAQSATWAAIAGSLEAVTATATFEQAATWAGLADHADTSVQATASFTQDVPVFLSTTQLKIIGYASPVPPSTFLEATGTVLEEWVP